MAKVIAVPSDKTLERPKKYFPIDTVGGLAYEFSRMLSDYMEAPPGSIAMSFMTLLGHIVSPYVRLRTSLDIQPRLYTVILGHSGTDHKSEAIKQAIKLFEEVYPMQYRGKGDAPTVDLYIMRGMNSGEALIKELADNPNLLLFYDEFNGFIAKIKGEKSTLGANVSLLYSDDRCVYRVKDTKIELENAHLSFITACTEDLWAKSWFGQTIDMGLLNRFFLVCDHSDKMFSLPPEIPLYILDTLKEKLLKIMKEYATKPSYTFELTKDARELWDAWYKQWLKKMKGDDNSLRRLDNLGHRLMLLWAVNEGVHEISEDMINRILRLLKWEFQLRDIKGGLKL